MRVSIDFSTASQDRKLFENSIGEWIIKPLSKEKYTHFDIIVSKELAKLLFSEKKDIYKNSLSYNILNIGIYFYTFMLYKITNTNTTLDIINNQTYYNNNYIMISILLIGLTIYTIVLNNEKI